MAALSTGAPTLIDYKKSLDPNGSVARVIENLTQNNPILQDIPMMQGNLEVGHQLTVRTGLPTPAWRLLNAGVQPSKGTTAQITEQTGMLESYSQVDVDLAKLNGNEAAFRAQQARPHYEAMAQEAASTLFYGTATAPEEFVGLSARYSVLSGAPIAENVIDGQGTDAADQSSIWLLVWHEMGITGIYPKGSQAGITHEDLGRQIVYGATGIGGSMFLAYIEHWQWALGVAVADWRQGVRIANIDTSNLIADSSAADLFNLMEEAVHRIHSLEMGRPVFYMNRTVARKLDSQARADVSTGGGLTYQNVDGKRLREFQGIPIHICDALLTTEEPVS